MIINADAIGLDYSDPILQYADELFSTRNYEPKILNSLEKIKLYGKASILLQEKENGYEEERCFGSFYIEKRIVPLDTFKGVFAIADNFFARWVLYHSDMANKGTIYQLSSVRTIKQGEGSLANAENRRKYTCILSGDLIDVWVLPRILAVVLNVINIFIAAFNITLLTALFIPTISSRIYRKWSSKEEGFPTVEKIHEYYVRKFLQEINAALWLTSATLFPENALRSAAKMFNEGNAENLFSTYENLDKSAGFIFVN